MPLESRANHNSWHVTSTNNLHSNSHQLSTTNLCFWTVGGKSEYLEKTPQTSKRRTRAWTDDLPAVRLEHKPLIHCAAHHWLHNLTKWMECFCVILLNYQLFHHRYDSISCLTLLKCHRHVDRRWHQYSCLSGCRWPMVGQHLSVSRTTVFVMLLIPLMKSSSFV